MKILSSLCNNILTKEVKLPSKKISPDRVKKKEANKLRYRQLNGHLGGAKKAFEAKDADATLDQLRKAYALTVKPTVWASEQKRVKARAKSYKVAVKALTA